MTFSEMYSLPILSLYDAESRVRGLITCFLNYSYSSLAEVRSACFDNGTTQLWKTSLSLIRSAACFLFWLWAYKSKLLVCWLYFVNCNA